MSTPQPWNLGVRGTQVLPLINEDASTIRVEAGPGTGKTFGLIRRIQRLLHPDGLAANGHDVLIVAFNRVIANQLRTDLDSLLGNVDPRDKPIVRTIHALCLDVVGHELRLLLPHEREAMIYDVLHDYPALAAEHGSYYGAAQALRDHEAKHKVHMPLWKACSRWLVRHRATLISDLPSLLLDRLKAGDLGEQAFKYVIVDEFQDLTSGEQELVFRMRKAGGQLVVLGDPRQSIYAFRGNDRLGLAKVPELLQHHGGGEVLDVSITECQRCPVPLVIAANDLMSLSGVVPMIPVSEMQANIHVVTWDNPDKEAAGMAKAIVKNMKAFPGTRHLAMVTRRRFGYQLRDEIAKVDPTLLIDLGFSESLLETWPAREAFLLFSALVDPDPPTWRAWFAYQNSPPGSSCTAPKRNAGAYLRLLTQSSDSITSEVVEALAGENRGVSRGMGGAILWDRATRFVAKRAELSWNGEDVVGFLTRLFDEGCWPAAEADTAESVMTDLVLLRDKAIAFYQEEQDRASKSLPAECLREVAKRLRHQIATREPLTTDKPSDLQVLTLWGSKGMTADHVYMLGVCDEAIPGERRDEYPGTDAEYIDEQRRLFYVSITRAKQTLVLSRARSVSWGDVKRLGLSKQQTRAYRASLSMCQFVREISSLPAAVAGTAWTGCSPQGNG